MSTIEHRPSPQASPSPAAPATPAPLPAAPRPAEPPFTDEPTDRFPVVPPRSRGPRPARMHRAQAGELAALAFLVPLVVPAPRAPAAVEFRAAS